MFKQDLVFGADMADTIEYATDKVAMQAEVDETERLRKQLQNAIVANLATVKVTMEREEGFVPANLFDANTAVDCCDRCDLVNWQKKGFKPFFQCWFDGAVVTIKW